MIQYLIKMGRADLHLHTNVSDGFFAPEEIVVSAVKQNLNVIAITDHGRIEGAVTARKYARKNNLPIEIIVGEEITTIQGELVGLFLKKTIPPFLDIVKTAKLIKEQKGIVFVPHPLRAITGYSASFESIEKLIQKKLVDAIEIYNFWDYGSGLPTKRAKKNKIWQLPELGNSDSHHKKTIGKCFTVFPGENISDLKKAIMSRKTEPKKQKYLVFKRREELRHLLLRTKQFVKNNKPSYPGKISFKNRLKYVIKSRQYHL